MKIISILLSAIFVLTLSLQLSAAEIIAHRGASYEAPENTLSAIKLGYDEKADGIEIDIHITKDKKLMLCHDGNLKRTTGFDLDIANATFTQLRYLDAGSWKSEKYRGEKIPTLQEALSLIPKNKKMFVEIKSTDTRLVPILDEIIKISGKKKNIVIICFNSDVLASCKKQMPDIPTYHLIGGNVTTPWTSFCENAKAKGIDGLDLQSHLITEESVKTIRQYGLSLHAWTVDNPNEANRIKALGVDSITTNKPLFIRNSIK